MVRFDDHVKIHVWVKEYNAIRMTLGYEMRDAATGELKTTGESRHCFLDTGGRPVSLKRSYSVGHRILQRGPGAGFPVMTASVGDAVNPRLSSHVYM